MYQLYINLLYWFNKIHTRTYVMFYGLYFCPLFSQSMYLLYLNQQVKYTRSCPQLKSGLSLQFFVLVIIIYKIIWWLFSIAVYLLYSTCFPFKVLQQECDSCPVSSLQSGVCFTSLRSGWHPHAPWCVLGRLSVGCTWYWFPENQQTKQFRSRTDALCYKT